MSRNIYLLFFFWILRDSIKCAAFPKVHCPNVEKGKNANIRCDFDRNTTNIKWFIINHQNQSLPAHIASCTSASCNMVSTTASFPLSFQIAQATVSPMSNYYRSQLEIRNVQTPEAATQVKFRCVENSDVNECQIARVYTLPTASLDPGCDDYIKDGETLQCECKVSQTGDPPGHVQWFDSSGSATGDTNTTLKLATLQVNYGMKSNSNSYTCKGKSSYGTQTTGVTFKPNFLVLPSVALSPNCSQGPNDFIKEGEMFPCVCLRDEPGDPPGSVKWFAANGDEIGDTSANGELTTLSVFHAMKSNGVPYTCRGVSPLSGNYSVGKTFSPKFGEQATVTAFTVNSASGSLAVSEGIKVTFLCTVKGNPTPSIDINPEVAGLSPKTTTDTLSSSLTLYSAQCHHTGVFTCNTSNYGVPPESTSRKSVTLLVRCSPELQEKEYENKTFVSSISNKAFISLPIMGYPPPTTIKLSLAKNGSVFDIWPNRYTMRYKRDSHSYGHVNLAMDDLELEDISTYYILTISNGIGTGLAYRFRLEANPESVKLRNENSKGDNDNLEISAAIGVGSGLGVLLIAVVIGGVIVYLWRRRRFNAKSSNPKPHLYHSTDGSKSQDNNYLPVVHANAPFYEDSNQPPRPKDRPSNPTEDNDETCFYETVKDHRAARQNVVQLPIMLTKQEIREKRRSDQRQASSHKAHTSSSEDECYENFESETQEKTYANF